MKWTGSSTKTALAVCAAFLAIQLIGVVPALLAAKSAKALYDEARAAEQQLKKSKSRQASKSAWLEAAGRYRKVVLSHPRSGYCDDALWYEAEIYRQVDQRFRDRDAVRRALDSYLQIVKGYPASKWCSQARLASAGLYLNRLSKPDAARKELRQVVSKWPKSKEASEARRILARLDGTSRPSGGRRVTVRNIRHWTGKEYTRIVIDMDEEVKHRQGRLTKPDRIYFDLLETRLSQDLAARTFPIGDGFLKQIRAGQNKPDVVRVVLDFDSISRYNVFSLYDPYRLVVDILGIKPKKEPVVAKKQPPTPAPKSSPPPPTGNTQSPVESPPTLPTETVASNDIPPPLPPDPTPDGRFPLARQLGLTARRIVIDPGHGGHDPGTMGRGLKEKDLVLDISRRVAKLLQRDGEFEVLMTRNDDRFIPLEERTAIANSQGADLFISIHANAHPNHRVRGIETFYLNLATSPEAEETAARENAVSTRRMAELQDLLAQIMNNSRIAESSDFAHRIQSQMVREVLRTSRGSSQDHGVKTAPFYVLLGANMPSVLVEVSFLSNQDDAKALATSEYRQTIAEAIAKAIQSYSGSLKKVAKVPSQNRSTSVSNKPDH